MRGSGRVRRRSRLGVLIAVAAVAISICAAAPTAAEPTRGAQTAVPSVTGTVTNSSGSPVAGVTVQLYLDSSSLLSTTTAADGTYAFSPAASSVQVAVGFSAAGYAPQWWNNKPSLATADLVTVNTGQTATGIDAVLQPETTTGSISGTVTDASTAQPLSGVSVTATNSATGQSTSLTDGADGTYGFSGLAPGSYTVGFTKSAYVDQWWNNKPALASADPVTVSAGQVASGVDAALAQVPSDISGTVTDNTGQPLAGVTVQALEPPGIPEATATTAADGTYHFTGLALSTYWVEFSAPGYFTQWWNHLYIQQTATPVRFSGQPVTGIDAVLQPGSTGVIAGKTGDENDSIIPNATIVATNTTTGETTSAQSDGFGNYSVDGLSPGTYTVEFSAAGYFSQWYDLKSSQATATPVTVTGGQIATGPAGTSISSLLTPTGGGAISGTVTNAAGQPVAGATVEVLTGNDLSTTTNAFGTYTIQHVLPGSYPVVFSAPGYVDQWWNNQLFLATAQNVTVAGTQTTTGINAQLHTTYLYGFVNGPSGVLAGATVDVFNYYGFPVTQTTTDASGNYAVADLPPGVYRVEFLPPAGSNLLPQWWDGAADAAHSSGVGINAGRATTIGATLTTGGSISGNVTNTAGPVAGATVGVFTTNASNQPAAEIAHTTTAADGTYSVAGLQAGNYDVLVDPPAGSADAGQWYNNSPTAGGATTITLATSGTATANAQLTTGQRGSISGTVTDQSGSPIAGSTVLAVAADGRTTTTTTTGPDGTYTIDNLDVGMYTVWFVPPAGSNLQGTLWNLAAGKILPVTVDQGSAITGIDPTLS